MRRTTWDWLAMASLLVVVIWVSIKSNQDYRFKLYCEEQRAAELVDKLRELRREQRAMIWAFREREAQLLEQNLNLQNRLQIQQGRH